MGFAGGSGDRFPELYRERTTVDPELRTGDLGGFVGGEEQDGVGDLFDPAGAAHRHLAQHLSTNLRIGGAPRRAHRRHQPRMDRIDPDVVGAVLHCRGLGQRSADQAWATVIGSAAEQPMVCRHFAGVEWI